MLQRPRSVRLLVGRLVGVLVVARVLAGCDRCGDFFPKFEAQVCKDEAPRPQ